MDLYTKNTQQAKKRGIPEIKAEDFTGIKVKEFKSKSQRKPLGMALQGRRCNAMMKFKQVILFVPMMILLTAGFIFHLLFLNDNN